MGHSSKRRRISPRRTISQRYIAIYALLSHATLTTAVALSDFAPQLLNLSESCQKVYTLPISGCTVADFTAVPSTCSSSCIAGLVQINPLVVNFCANDDVPEISIVSYFKIGQAIQVLCNVAVVTTTPNVPAGGVIGGPATTSTKNTGTNTFSSTMTMSQVTSSVLSQTRSLTSQSVQPTSNGMIGNTPLSPSPSSAFSSRTTDTTLRLPTSSATRTLSSITQTISGAALESLKSGNIEGGGGSPFDNIDNSEATSLRAIGGIMASMITVSVIAMVLGLS